VKVQRVVGGGEQGQKDKVAHARAEAQGRAESREDKQKIQDRRVFLDERFGGSGEDAKEVRECRHGDYEQDYTYGAHVAGKRDADGGGGKNPEKVDE
jgi:hypothetical protein